MAHIPDGDIRKRLAFDNPWWTEGQVSQRYRNWMRRAHFDGFYKLFRESRVHRAVILMGPRRIGKTVMLIQSIQQLMDDGVDPKAIFYVSVDTPTYIGLTLEQLLNHFMEMSRHGRGAELFVIFDEIQYHPDWERHLKSLVDSYPNIRFVGSGSAAAALKAKSLESGVGRFTDFLLPPLSLAEFIRFSGRGTEFLDPESETTGIVPNVDLPALDELFLDYVNFGGFPEAVVEEAVRHSMDRFVANDVLDKVLLRDLPSIYGISNPQELKRLFAYLAFNSGAEFSYENLSKESGIAKNTLRKYLDYLEAAFLIKKLNRLDNAAQRMKREVGFKVYLTITSLRSALFGPIESLDTLPGLVAETAFVSQFAQGALGSAIHYAKWKDREVDLVVVSNGNGTPLTLIEIKWSDRAYARPKSELPGLLELATRFSTAACVASTRSIADEKKVGSTRIIFRPLSLLSLYTAIQGVEDPLKKKMHPVTLQTLTS